MATQPQVTAGSRQQLLLVGALAAVLALVLGVLVVRPMLSRGTEEVATPPPATAGAAPTPTTTPQLAGPSSSLPTGGAVGSAKDPFRPLVSAGSAAAATETGVTPAAGATAGTTAATASTVPGAGAGTASTPGGGATAERKVTLVNVANGQARVSVDGRSYTVEEGERFAGDYRAVDIGTECATFESGTTPFTLCEGEAVLK
jgi:hypothetical protein